MTYYLYDFVILESKLLLEKPENTIAQVADILNLSDQSFFGKYFKRITIIYANDNFKKVSQYTDDELIGKNHRIVRSGHHPKSFFEDMWRIISSGKLWEREILNRAKDGSLYWLTHRYYPCA